MGFLTPGMLLGGLAIGIPIALHFFFRSRYRTVPWAAMKFLLTAIEQTSRRLRFQELLLLLLRCAVLLLLALALARPRPISSASSSSGDAVHAVFVIDTSFSMLARDGVAPQGKGGDDTYLTALRELAGQNSNVTRFDRARAAALAVLANLPPHSSVEIITCSDRAELIGPRNAGELDQGEVLIRNLQATHQAGDLQPGIIRAAQALENSHEAGRELYVFSDMQRSGWDPHAESLRSLFSTVQSQARVYLVHCARQEAANAAIVGIAPQSTIQAGDRVDCAVLVRNSGKNSIRNLPVSLRVDGNTEAADTKVIAELKAKETQSVIISVDIGTPGSHVLTAEMSGDDLDVDNRFDQVVQARDQLNILLIDGSPNPAERKSGTYYVAWALGERVPRRIKADEASIRHLDGKDLCILVDVAVDVAQQELVGARPGFLKALADFVKKGHGLLIFPGNHVIADDYNKVLFDQFDLLPTRIDKLAPAEPNLRLDHATAVNPFAGFRRDESYASLLGKAEFQQVLELEEPRQTSDADLTEHHVLLRFNNGKPAFVGQKHPGAGEVLLSANFVSVKNPDDERLYWHVSPAFVPFMHLAVNYLAEGPPLPFNRVAGEQLSCEVPSETSHIAHDLIKPDGERVPLGLPSGQEGKARLTTEPVTLAGVYSIEPIEGGVEAADLPSGLTRKPQIVPFHFAVVPDLRETEDLESYSAPQLDEQLGFRPSHLFAGDNGADFAAADRLKQEWTVPLLWLLLALVLGETLFAWFCGRAR